MNQHNLHGNQGLYILYISQDWYDKFHNVKIKIILDDKENIRRIKLTACKECKKFKK